jgi:hypothetical protein
MKLMRRAVLAVVLTVLAGGACWQCRAVLGAKGEPPNSRLLAGPGEEIRVIDQRVARKEEVIGRLIAGEITLLEAAAWFRDLNDDPPDRPCDFRQLERGRSDGEKACRQVVGWVRSSLINHPDPAEAAKVLARLERELEERAAAKEPIELPW